MGSNGLPVAINARPSVQVIKSAGVASLFDVGLESGKISGCSANVAMLRIIFSVNAPGCADVPIRMVGQTFSTTSANEIFERSVNLQLSVRSIGWAYFCLNPSRLRRLSYTRPWLSTSQMFARA